jgi:hypothetical protein
MARGHFIALFSLNKRLIMVAAAPLILLLAVNVWLSAKSAHMSRLLKRHECRNITCRADFNGDGEEDLILVDETAPPLPYYTSWLTVNIEGREELRLPLRETDGSFRTHVSTLTDDGRARLLLADGITGREKKESSTVLAWNGHAFAPQQPSAEDQELLSAMMAFDDAGRGPYWAAFIVLKWPAYLLCLLLLSLTFKRLKRPAALR